MKEYDSFCGIIFRQDTLLYTDYKLGKLSNVTNALSTYLNQNIHIETGTNVRDIFKILKKNKNVLFQIFPELETLLKRALRLPIGEFSCLRNNYFADYLEFSCGLERVKAHKYPDNYKIDMHIVSDLDTSQLLYIKRDRCLAGRYFPESTTLYYDLVGKIENQDTRFGLLGTNLFHIIDLPIKINNKLVISDVEYNQDSKRQSKIEKFCNFENISLYSFLDTFIFELSLTT